MSTLFLIFNHRFTPEQEADARASLGISEVVVPPSDLRERWSNIPPDLSKLSGYLNPIRDWLIAQARPGIYVLIQGDFGAGYLLVCFALERGLIPVYSTTRRQAEEEVLNNGSVKLIHHFEHRIFRKYGE